jgi:hypothetical protein
LSAGASASPAGLTARARPKARPETRAANLRVLCKCGLLNTRHVILCHMTFNEEARRLAQQARADNQARQEEAKKLDEQRAAEEHRVVERKCKVILTQWFDEIGMLPHPKVTVGPMGWRYSGSWEDDIRYPVVEVTWRYESYNYRASFDPGNPKLPGVQIYARNQWFPADTKFQIGNALLIS